MNYLRPLYFILSLAIGGCLCESVSHKTTNAIVKNHFPSDHATTILDGHCYNPPVETWWNKIMTVNAQPNARCSQHGYAVSQVEEEKKPRKPDKKVPQNPDKKVPRDPDKKVPRDPDKKVPRDPDKKIPQDPDKKDSDPDDNMPQECDEDEDEDEEHDNEDYDFDDDDDEDESDEHDDDDKHVEATRVFARLVKSEFSQFFPEFAYGYPDKAISTRSFVTYKDYVTHVDSRTRTPAWTVQRITRENWGKVEHAHCETFTIEHEMPPNFRFRRQDNDKRVAIRRILTHRLYKKDGQMICNSCAHSRIWKVFHAYISLLLQMYNQVQVCSGQVYLNDGNADLPSHYFKVICCKNSDGATYRFECYKIGNEDMVGGIPELKNFLVSRMELEECTGFKIFDHVREDRIKQQETHSMFQRH